MTRVLEKTTIVMNRDEFLTKFVPSTILGSLRFVLPSPRLPLSFIPACSSSPTYTCRLRLVCLKYKFLYIKYIHDTDIYIQKTKSKKVILGMLQLEVSIVVPSDTRLRTCKVTTIKF